MLGYANSRWIFLRPALFPAYRLSSGIGSLGGNGLIDPPCPKDAVDMTDKQLQLHPDPQVLVPFSFYYVQLMIITK